MFELNFKLGTPGVDLLGFDKQNKRGQKFLLTASYLLRTSIFIDMYQYQCNLSSSSN